MCGSFLDRQTSAERSWMKERERERELGRGLSRQKKHSLLLFPSWPRALLGWCAAVFGDLMRESVKSIRLSASCIPYPSVPALCVCDTLNKLSDRTAGFRLDITLISSSFSIRFNGGHDGWKKKNSNNSEKYGKLKKKTKQSRCNVIPVASGRCYLQSHGNFLKFSP